ncbi:unnamed protein product [Tetraodon nigroviridis]|uniref:(spotted green pufferfish) hypothetical protein n=1 Tax=Tetraodon nigroviridis TaxID=99883 RepID=Q4T8K7_TETNG|nr:unnamed protein product [Tetraodon nigroviridis]
MGSSLSSLAAFQALHVVMLGLDSAGKTTVLYRLRFNEFVNTVPTIGFNTERIRLGGAGASRGISCHFWDVGGQEKLRPLWKPYSRCTDGIVYVVDSVDAERLEEARAELHKITRFSENQGTAPAGHRQQAGPAPGAGRRGDRPAAGPGRAQPLHALPRPAGLRHHRGGSGRGHGPAVRDDRQEEEVPEAEEEEAVTGTP